MLEQPGPNILIGASELHLTEVLITLDIYLCLWYWNGMYLVNIALKSLMVKMCTALFTS